MVSAYNNLVKTIYGHMPDSPGVYIMQDVSGQILYIGKAANLKRRVSSYFLRPHDSRIQTLVGRIHKIDYRKTDTAIEALILEAELIKKFQPPFNVREKDDTSFLFVEITKDDFPRVLLVRGKEKSQGERFGPFTAASHIREALRIVRKIFPFSVHPTGIKYSRGCFDYGIGLCPGTCIHAVSKKDYTRNIKNIRLFFEGKKEQIIKSLEREMQSASKSLEFEKAETLKRQLFALQHIQDVALISEDKPRLESTSPLRIEGYDISNISGTAATGSMVVFRGSEPDKDQYRKFKIRSITGPDDVGMLKEVMRRRFSRSTKIGGWPTPDLLLIDGGRGQINGVKMVLNQLGIKIPVIGIAKGPERKRNDIIGIIPRGVSRVTLIRVRDEAHRFAVGYHKRLRSREFLPH